MKPVKANVRVKQSKLSLQIQKDPNEPIRIYRMNFKDENEANTWKSFVLSELSKLSRK